METTYEFGVFVWRGDARYMRPDAVKVFRTQKQAEAYIRRCDPNAMKGWVPRMLVAEPAPAAVPFVDVTSETAYGATQTLSFAIRCF